MPVKTNAAEYQKAEIGTAYLARSILQRAGMIAAIDQELKHQPEIAVNQVELPSDLILDNGDNLAKTQRYWRPFDTMSR